MRNDELDSSVISFADCRRPFQKTDILPDSKASVVVKSVFEPLICALKSLVISLSPPPLDEVDDPKTFAMGMI